MAAIITANNRNVQNKVAPAPALREDGSNYPFRMAYQDNSQFADADTLEELIAILFGEDYLALETAEERLEARKNYAARIQIQARSLILAQLEPEQTDNMPDWEWSVLSYGEDEGSLDPYGWGTGWADDEEGTLGEKKENSIDVWSSEIPLVLVTTSYAPFTDIPKPLSSEGDFKYVKNIIWIRPETEKEFLRSLSHTGYIKFGEPQAAPRANAKAHRDA